MSRADLVVSEPSHVARARLLATLAAQQCGLRAERVHLVALAAAELAGNLLKHAANGVFTVVTSPDRLDVLSTDTGPGIRRTEECVVDGFSSSGTLGVGLGAVRRAADVFDIYSLFGSGTAVLAGWHLGEPRLVGPRVGAAMFTAPGETACGDRWTAVHSGTAMTVAVSDGLGHGEAAALASRAAITAITGNATRVPAEILTAIQPSLTSTRGATVAVSQIRPGEGRMRFCGIGNVAVRLHPTPDERAQRLVSLPGIVGAANPHRPTDSARAWSPRSWLLMHTDGVSERWSVEEWPGLLDHDPATVAAWILGQRGRGRDDACVVAVAGGGTR